MKHWEFGIRQAPKQHIGGCYSNDGCVGATQHKPYISIDLYKWVRLSQIFASAEEKLEGIYKFFCSRYSQNSQKKKIRKVSSEKRDKTLIIDGIKVTLRKGMASWVTGV